MTRRYVLILAAIAAALLVAFTFARDAQAAVPTWAQVRTASSPLTPQSAQDMTTARAQRIAAAAWGLTEPISVVRLSLDGPGGVLAYTLVSPPNETQDETVYFDSGDLPMPWEDYETVMTHEYGHLAGFDHAPDGANSIMAPTDALDWKYGIPRHDWQWLGTVHGRFNNPTPYGPPSGLMTTGRWAPRIDWSGASVARHHARRFVEYAR